MSWWRLRQVALAAGDLDAVMPALRAALGVDAGFADPGVGEFGLRNEVLAVGDTFLEVVAPVREGTTAGRFLDRTGGDGGYMVILQTDDVRAARDRVVGLGIRVVWQIDLDEISGTHLHPRDVGGAIVSLDEARPRAAWRWAGPDWQARASAGRTGPIVAVDIAAHEPDGMAARWAQVVDRPVRDGVDGAFEVHLDDGILRFVPSGDASERVVALDVNAGPGAVSGDAVALCGITIRFT